MTSPPQDTPPTGVAALYDPHWNKGTAFTDAERDALGLRGLLPPRVLSQDEQMGRVLENFRHKNSPLQQYIFLAGLQDRNERLFYRTVVANIDEMLPIIYTPTVGEACRNMSHIFRRPRGLYVSAEDRGRVAAVLRNWPRRDVAVIVVTDGERILGLGDLGAQGMGIPIGKLALYTACAGVDPARCLPIMLDVGTNNTELLADPLYFGLPQRRVAGDDYLALVDELVDAVGEVFPDALLQFEDFATEHAIGLLARYRDRARTFNDDIQGTAAVTLAGLLSAGRATGRALADETLLFLGAGAAATGIADLIVAALLEAGVAVQAARERIWFMDSRGLVVGGRGDLAAHKRRYAHDHAPVADLAEAVAAVRPTALIGVSGQGGTFTPAVLGALASVCDRPLVAALSNPTASAECTAEEAYRHTGGRALFVSGSPFPPVTWDGTTRVPRQGNNVYIFPGLGLGVVVSRARHVTDTMFLAAARTLATHVAPADLAQGSLYPPLAAIRDVSAAIAVAVAEVAYAEGLAEGERPDDLGRAVRDAMYVTSYPDYTAQPVGT